MKTRWQRYIVNSIINPILLTDIRQIARIDKPAVFRNVFGLGCLYSSQVLAMKAFSEFIDGVRDVTVADHLEHLRRVGLLVKIPKYTGSHARQRSAPPKLNVLIRVGSEIITH